MNIMNFFCTVAKFSFLMFVLRKSIGENDLTNPSRTPQTLLAKQFVALSGTRDTTSSYFLTLLTMNGFGRCESKVCRWDPIQ